MHWEYITEANLAIQIHLFAALLALGFGIFIWFQPKGTKRHKLAGRVFVAFMIIAAISAIFIRQLNQGSFSWIHIFVPITLLGAWQAIYHIRRGNLKKHKKAVQGMFFGALLIPGLFSFLPGRTLWRLFFG